MAWLQKVMNGVQGDATIIEATCEHKIKPDYDDGKDADADMSVYFIKVQALIEMISGGKMPATFAFRLSRAFNLFTYNARQRTFEPVVDIDDAVAFFIRYDQCLHLMHTWLEQMIEWREANQLPIPEHITQTYRELNSSGNAATLLAHIFQLEIACRDVIDTNSAFTKNVHSKTYNMAAEMVSRFLFELGLRYRTMKMSDHPLCHLNRFPFASFVFEGFFLLNQNVFEMLRRPFVQMNVILPRFNNLQQSGRLDAFIASGKTTDIPASLPLSDTKQNVPADITAGLPPSYAEVEAADARAAALIRAEEQEMQAAIKKREVRKAKRMRQVERKNDDRRKSKDALMTSTQSKLRYDAPEFVPQSISSH